MFEVVGDVCAIHMSNKHVVPDALAAKQAQLDMATRLIESHSGQHEQQQAALNRLTAEASAPCTRAHLHECMHAHAHAQVCAHVRHAHAHAHTHTHTHLHFGMVPIIATTKLQPTGCSPQLCAAA